MEKNVEDAAEREPVSLLRNNRADVDEVHLSAVATVRRINDNASAVWAKTRVCIASPFAFVLRRQMKTAKRNLLVCLNIIEVNVLFSLFVRICVV